MTKVPVQISFPEESPDKANALVESLAKDLRREVQDDGKHVDPEIVRIDATAQDFGTALVLVLGTPAIIILAKAILAWAKRTDRADVTINGLRVTNLNSKDVADVVTALSSHRK